MLLALTILSVACSGPTTPAAQQKPTGSAVPADSAPPLDTSANPETPPVGSQPPEEDELGWIFDTPGDPIDVVVVPDTAAAVEAVIPVEGGTVSATGADGTIYTLDIPADALLTETTIGLTPVDSISGMPFGNDETHAVQLSPEGLFFQNFAVLTIDPIEEIPAGEQIVFGYQGEGKDLILAPPVVESSEIKIHVLHFSGNGITKGLLADIEPVRERLGGDIERRLQSAISEALGRERQRQLLGLNPDPEVQGLFESAMSEYERLVVKPRVAAAGESCATGQLALQTVLGLERQRQLLGISDGAGSGGLEEYPGLIDKVARVCLLEEFELCVEQHVLHRMAQVWHGYERQFALLGVQDSAVLREARDLTIACLTFRLEFESEGSFRAGGGGWESTVSAEIKLTYDPEAGMINGDAPMVVEAFETIPPPNCRATNYRNDGGTFKVFNMQILTAKPDGLGSVGWVDPTGLEVQLALAYFPGLSTASYDLVCRGGTIHVPSSAAWTSIFVSTHTADFFTRSTEMPSDAGYLALDWEVFGDEYFATKEWTTQAAGGFVEAGAFHLHHTPGE